LEESSSSSTTWRTIQIPFTSFQIVRGSVAVINGPSLNLTRGIYQIGLIMSKFKIGPTMTEMDNFRSGYLIYISNRLVFINISLMLTNHY